VAEYSRRVVTTRRVEYFTPAPTNGAEFGKAFTAASAEAARLGDVADDTLTVEGNDEEIVISFVLGDPLISYERESEE
jgi:hypothetical protein